MGSSLVRLTVPVHEPLGNAIDEDDSSSSASVSMASDTARSSPQDENSRSIYARPACQRKNEGPKAVAVGD